jgi:hypothetical protein
LRFGRALRDVLIGVVSETGERKRHGNDRNDQEVPHDSSRRFAEIAYPGGHGECKKIAAWPALDGGRVRGRQFRGHFCSCLTKEGAMDQTVNTLQRCANCDDVIGKLETPFLWKEQVVCERCYNKLAKVVSPAAPVEPRRCPVCGSGKPPVKKAYGCVLVPIILFTAAFLPWMFLPSESEREFHLAISIIFVALGIAFWIRGFGVAWVCPDCKTRLGSV